MKKIIFVCTGNTCRSPMAEGLFRHLLEERGITDVAVSSAGLMAVPGDPVSENSATVMAEIGMDISGHRARPFTPEMLDAERIITMTGHQAALLRQITDKAAPMPREIPDPYGGSVEDYRACRDAISAALPAVLEELIHGD